MGGRVSEQKAKVRRVPNHVTPSHPYLVLRTLTHRNKTHVVLVEYKLWVVWISGYKHTYTEKFTGLVNLMPVNNHRSSKSQ